jgi:hypothetical protein
VVRVPERRNGGSRAVRRDQPGPNTTATPTPIRTTDGLSVADGANAERQARAKARIAAQDRHHRICRELERLAPLRHYYSRPLLNVPFGALDARGRWAA